jgi:hypothetical protein
MHAMQQRWDAARRARMRRLAFSLAVSGFVAILGANIFPKEIGWLVGSAGLIALFFAYVFGKLAR